MRNLLRHSGAAAAALLLIASAAVAVAQSSGDVVLHEYFNPWDVEVSRAAPSSEGAQAEPSANDVRRGPGDPPGLSVDPGEDEVILGANGLVDRAKTSEPYGPLDPREQSSKLDDRTDRVDQLNYYANFEPSVVPYKRVVVQNQVRYAGGDYLLALQAGRTQRVRVEGGDAKPGEETFWGSFLVRANKGEPHPLPSVAPSQRILEVQSEPDVGVRFEKDAADNFYIVPQTDGLLRLNVRIAVPSNYFNGDFRADVSWSDFRNPQTPDLPRSVAGVASEVLGAVGVSRQMSPHDVLRSLVEHYRDFEGRAFPDEMRGEDLYSSLSREQVGVCRHRSLAFLISARALGFSTRYIYNEAHAFVEVYWPTMGWRRIDLGGAADELDYSAQSGARVHDAGQDTLPQPPNYQEELDRMSEQSGETGDEERGGEAAVDESSSERADTALEDAATGGQDPSAARGDARHDELHEGDGRAEGAMSRSQQAGAEQGELSQPDHAQSASEHDGRSKVIIDAEVDTSEIFRGNSLGVRGSLFTERGQPLSKREITVFLGPVGSRSGEGLVELGTVRTDAGGRYRGELSIPDSVSIGRWSVILQFAGDEEHSPARAE